MIRIMIVFMSMSILQSVFRDKIYVAFFDTDKEQYLSLEIYENNTYCLNIDQETGGFDYNLPLSAGSIYVCEDSTVFEDTLNNIQHNAYITDSSITLKDGFVFLSDCKFKAARHQYVPNKANNMLWMHRASIDTLSKQFKKVRRDSSISNLENGIFRTSLHLAYTYEYNLIVKNQKFQYLFDNLVLLEGDIKCNGGYIILKTDARTYTGKVIDKTSFCFYDLPLLYSSDIDKCKFELSNTDTTK